MCLLMLCLQLITYDRLLEAGLGLPAVTRWWLLNCFKWPLVQREPLRVQVWYNCLTAVNIDGSVEENEVQNRFF